MPTSPSSTARSAASPSAAAKPQRNGPTAARISLLAVPLLAIALSRRRGPRVFTKAELAQYVDIKHGLKVAICGQVFDVTKGAEFYAKGAGYGFFAGRDASLAFATGNFKTNLTDNVSSLADAQLLDLQNWVNDTYHKKYVHEGVVAGYFYDAKGQPTEAHKDFDERVEKAREAAARQALDVEKYPDCASRRTQTERSVSCKKGRVPIRRRTETGTERCACVLERDEGLGAKYENCTVSEGGRTSCALG
ncbi:unnamed protein product [Pelagomonas calceolata]|uniref:Cytochrome b5 heme-binding domain-containing protein n=1 Tax=Pelagomonas calceolata TaxID=35677 RepID=A0A8J2SBQ8_9STRA|nr:unnamed protein product [Pelagomonas calceolata]